MIEVEIKSKLTSEIQGKIQECLQQMHFERSVQNVDVYYDTASYDLLQQAVFLRIRNSVRLEFKFNEKIEKEHGQSTERSYPLVLDVPQREKMNRLFTRFLPNWRATDTIEEAIATNGLIELAHIDNQRMEYSQNDFYLSLDQVKDLGDFVEVEVRCEEETDTSEAQTKLQAFAADLGLQHIRVGYVELWLQKYNPPAYLLGKYHL